VGGEVAVGAYGDQPAPQRQPVARLAQVVACGALDRIRRGHHAVQGPVFGDPLRGRLGSHLVDPGHVVHRVAEQRQVVDDAIRRHAELGLHGGHVQAFVAHGVDQRDALVDQLREVLVAGGDDDVVAAGGRDAGQRADRVVGLDAGHLQQRPAQQPHRLVDGRDLLRQRPGHGLAVGLVLGVPVVAEGRALGVEDTDRVRGGVLLAQALHHRDEAVHGAGRDAVGPAQVGHRVVGAVQVAAAVDQQHDLVVFRLAHAAIVAWPRA
jgi:hypothetical protein